MRYVAGAAVDREDGNEDWEEKEMWDSSESEDESVSESISISYMGLAKKLALGRLVKDMARC